MGKCANCGRWGLFLKTDSAGLCKTCREEKARHDFESSLASVESSTPPISPIPTLVTPPERNTAFFKNGIFYAVKPHYDGSIYDARDILLEPDCIIVSDGTVYDPEHPESIKGLSVIEYHRTSNASITSPVLDLSYNLKMKCGVIEDGNLLPDYVAKTLELMIMSPIAYLRSDYLQAIRNYYRLGMLDLGNSFECEFRNRHPELFSNKLTVLKECEHLRTKYHFEDQNYKANEFKKLTELFPDLMPETLKGYLQIRSRRTKRFLTIQAAAKEKGIEIPLQKPYHYCKKKNCVVGIEYIYRSVPRDDNTPPAREYNELIACRCNHMDKDCNGRNEFGLACVYPPYSR